MCAYSEEYLSNVFEVDRRADYQPAPWERSGSPPSPPSSASLSLLVPGTAAARTITVGGELTGPALYTISFAGPTATIANAELAGPNATVAPVDGRIVRWRMGPSRGPTPID